MSRIFKSHTTKQGETQWAIDYFEPSGKRVRRVVGTKAEAKDALAQVLVELKSSTYRETRSEDMTLADLREMWFARRGEKRSIKADVSRWAWIVRFFKATTAVADVTSEDVETFKSWLKDQKTRRGTKLKPGSINRTIQLLRAAMTMAVRLPAAERPIRENPVTGVRMLREKARTRIASPSEVKKLIEKASPKMALAIRIALSTGAREGEIARMKCGDVNLRARSVFIYETKTDKPRTVPVPRYLAKALAHCAKTDPATRLVGLRADAISTKFGKLCERLKIQDLHFHDLRRTCATRLRRAGVDLMTIKALLGHASWASMETYQQVLLDDLHEAIERPSRNRKRKRIRDTE